MSLKLPITTSHFKIIFAVERAHRKHNAHKTTQQVSTHRKQNSQAKLISIPMIYVPFFDGISSLRDQTPSLWLQTPPRLGLGPGSQQMWTTLFLRSLGNTATVCETLDNQSKSTRFRFVWTVGENKGGGEVFWNVKWNKIYNIKETKKCPSQKLLHINKWWKLFAQSVYRKFCRQLLPRWVCCCVEPI